MPASSTIPDRARVICLSNVYDQHYHDLRGEDIARSLGAKRQVLFECLAEATGRELLVLSAPPKALKRRTFKWLPPVETRFAGQRQLFCANWDGPKLRIPFSWWFYVWHVLNHVRSGDLVLIDNYEFIYVLAAWWLRIFRRVTFILDYEDGKHLIDRSWAGVLSGLAEQFGKKLIRAALLANPKMADRLPTGLPTEVIPGFIPQRLAGLTRQPKETVHFLYSGSMDPTRGLDLLLAALEHLPKQGWHLDISGQGKLAEEVKRFVQEQRWRDRVTYHGPLPTEDYNALLAAVHVGMNCQRANDPISDVTFPSKVFTYLTAGLLVISSQGSAVKELCGNACFYYDQETPQSLAAAMTTIMKNYPAESRKLDLAAVSDKYSKQATTNRLHQLLQRVQAGQS